ncbi:MAG: hypothetical protein PWR03_2360 [Tenuifilum sp.]|nr:hypothetical protein [Tenuifilum sp.]
MNPFFHSTNQYLPLRFYRLNKRVFFNQGKIRFKKRISMFLFFLIFSTILWLLIKLSHQYVDNITYRVELVNLPSNKVLVNSENLKINAKVSAVGYKLLQYKLFKPLRPIQLSAASSKRQGKDFFILTSSQFNEVSLQLGSELKLVDISPDTLEFSLSSVVKRTVEIKPQLKITYAKQYMQSGSFKLKPNRITITGPASVIDTIKSVTTYPLVLDEISDTIKQELFLKPIPDVYYSQNKVSITLPVEKFTEVIYQIPIKCINLPSGYEVQFSPNSVKVSCNVAVSKYFLVKPELFNVACDYNEIEKSQSPKAVLKLVSYPNFVSRIQVEPRQVDYIIIKK